MWFSPIDMAQLHIGPYPIGVLGCKCPVGMVSLPFSSHKLSHRGLGINVHLGIGTLPIVNKPMDMLLLGALMPQMLINSHIKEAHAPTLTP